MRLIICILIFLLPSSLGAQTAFEADFDGNGKVDFEDFVVFAQAYGSVQTQYDFDGSGKVDFEDFLGFAQVYGQTVSQATISGRVLSSGRALSNVVIMLVGNDTTATAMTDTAGVYSFDHMLSGQYTLTPINDARAFLPDSLVVTVLDTDVGVGDFEAQTAVIESITHSLSHAVTGINNPPIGTAKIQGEGSGPIRYLWIAQAANGSVFYSDTLAVEMVSGIARIPAYSGLPAAEIGEYLVILKTVDPTVERSVSAVRYSVFVLGSISGHVLKMDVGIKNARVSLIGATNDVVLTNEEGFFRFIEVPEGTYTLGISANGYTFSPDHREVSLAGNDMTEQDFMGVPIPVDPGDGQSGTSPPASNNTTGEFSEAEVGYFMEIAFGAEFGNASAQIRKWVQNPRIQVFGTPTQQDLTTLTQVVNDVNGLIQGVQLEYSVSNPTIEIYFVPESQFGQYLSSYIPTNFGFFWVWWNGQQQLIRSRILISTDRITQQERSHIIREELTQSLGLMQDSWTYPNSIFYQGWTTTTDYSPLDRSVIRMLYDTRITVGMSRNQVRAVFLGSPLVQTPGLRLKPTEDGARKIPGSGGGS